jgi:hypothetical protein
LNHSPGWLGGRKEKLLSVSVLQDARLYNYQIASLFLNTAAFYSQPLFRLNNRSDLAVFSSTAIEIILPIAEEAV